MRVIFLQKVIIDKELLEELWINQDISIRKMEKILDISVKTISKNIKEHGLVKEEKDYTKKEWLHQKHCVEKLNSRQIAKLAGVHYNIIQAWMKKHGIEFDKEVTNLSKRKYTDDTHYFDEIDTEEKAYWLGFLMADGSINRTTLSIALSGKDKSHLEKFLNGLDSDRKVYDYEQSFDKNGKTHKMSRIDIASFHLLGKLRSYGFEEKKSMKEVIPNEITKELLRHFIRGYFDGDGCFTYGESKNKKKFMSVSILGGEDFLNKLKKILNKENVLCNVYKKQDKESGSDNLRVMMIHHNQALAFLNYIYKDSTIYLDRKYEKYNKYLNDHKKK